MNANTVSLTNGAQIASSSQIVAPGAGRQHHDQRAGLGDDRTGVGPADGVGSITFTGSPSSGIFSTTATSGAGGNISLDTGSLEISGGAIVSAASTGTSAILGGTPGNAGNINIVGDTLHMDNGTHPHELPR